MKSIERALTRGLLLGIMASSGFACLVVFQAVRSLLLRDFDSTLGTLAASLATQTKMDSGGAIFIDFSDEAMPEFSGPLASACFLKTERHL